MTNRIANRPALRLAAFRVPISHRAKIEKLAEACHIAGGRMAGLLLKAYLDREFEELDRQAHGNLPHLADQDILR